MKKLTASVLALLLVFSLVVPAFAEEEAAFAPTLDSYISETEEEMAIAFKDTDIECTIKKINDRLVLVSATILGLNELYYSLDDKQFETWWKTFSDSLSGYMWLLQCRFNELEEKAVIYFEVYDDADGQLLYCMCNGATLYDYFDDLDISVVELPEEEEG